VSRNRNPLVVVHGGVDNDPTDKVLDGLRAAIAAAWACLDSGEPAVAAAVAAVCALEDHPDFNAGYGAVLTAEGNVELDAAVLDVAGDTFGGVLCVSSVRNPVRIAERLAAHPDAPLLLSGRGAEAFARKEGLEFASLVSPAQAESWADFAHDISVLTGHHSGDTVGAIVSDGTGLAVATSSGGLLRKWPGRVGDSPILGAGLHGAGSAAAMCSGIGELALRSHPALTAVNVRLGGGTVEAAALDALDTALRAGSELFGVVVADADTADVAVSCSGHQFPVMASSFPGTVDVVDPLHLPAANEGVA